MVFLKNIFIRSYGSDGTDAVPYCCLVLASGFTAPWPMPTGVYTAE